MGWFSFGKQKEEELENPVKAEQTCICGRNLHYEDCHALEFELPLGARPDPD